MFKQDDFVNQGVMAFTVEPDNYDSFIDFNVQVRSWSCGRICSDHCTDWSLIYVFIYVFSLVCLYMFVAYIQLQDTEKTQQKHTRTLLVMFQLFFLTCDRTVPKTHNLHCDSMVGRPTTFAGRGRRRRRRRGPICQETKEYQSPIFEVVWSCSNNTSIVNVTKKKFCPFASIMNMMFSMWLQNQKPTAGWHCVSSASFPEAGKGQGDQEQCVSFCRALVVFVHCGLSSSWLFSCSCSEFCSCSF